MPRSGHSDEIEDNCYALLDLILCPRPWNDALGRKPAYAQQRIKRSQQSRQPEHRKILDRRLKDAASDQDQPIQHIFARRPVDQPTETGRGQFRSGHRPYLGLNALRQPDNMRIGRDLRHHLFRNLRAPMLVQQMPANKQQAPGIRIAKMTAHDPPVQLRMRAPNNFALSTRRQIPSISSERLLNLCTTRQCRSRSTPPAP